MIQRVVNRIEPAEEPGPDGNADQRAGHHDRRRLAVRLLPGIGEQRRGADEIVDEQKRRDQPRRGETARQRHEDQRRAETGKAARRARHQGDHADRDRNVVTDIARDEAGSGHHPRNTPPVLFVTSATILAPTASISWSVMVFSRGWIVTAIAIDFLPSSMPLPS